MFRPSLIVVSVASVLMAAAACDARPSVSGASDPPSPSSTPIVEQPERSLTLAVARRNGGVALYTVSSDHHVHLQAALAGHLSTVSLASTGRVCGSWRRTVTCLDRSGPTVIARGDVEQIALSDDGLRVAWVDWVPRAGWSDPVPDVVVARADGRQIKRLPNTTDPCPNSTPGDLCVNFTSPNGLAVIGDQLLITSSCESDDGCTLTQQDIRTATTWGGRQIRPPDSEQRYTAYDHIGAGTATTALVEERGYDLDDDAPPSRAVLVDLATSRVLTVIATAAEGRFIARISGGSRGWAYTTATSTDDHGIPVGARHYVRFPGESQGALLVGLPSDVVQIAAA